jgi:hypothetical protein
LCNEELHNPYSSPHIIRIIKSRRMRWERFVGRMKEKRNAYRILVGKPEGRRAPGKPRRRREDNIKMDIREIVLGGMCWIHLAQDRDQWGVPINMATFGFHKVLVNS